MLPALNPLLLLAMLRTTPLLLALLFCFFAQPAVFAQDAPMKWGKIPPEDLAMTAYPADSNAAAVILADYGVVDLKFGGKLVFKRHRRIKILTEAGYEWGTMHIPYLDEVQKVKGLKGHTFERGPDGRLVKHKLDKKAIFEEDLNGQQKVVRFTMPKLSPGVIIEYEYRIETDSPIYFPTWTFQTSEPTRWSEYRIETSILLDYAFIKYGPFDYLIEERKERASHQEVKYRWAMQDLPALRDEPFMHNPADNLAALEIQLRGFLGLDLLTSWGDVAGRMLATRSLGNFSAPDAEIARRAQELTTGILSPLERLKALYGFIQSNIEWNGYAGPAITQSLKQTLEQGRGSATEVNMLLVAMLRSVGLQAAPVMTSTRAHGRVVENYPIMSQFNYVLLHTEIFGQTYLVDATDPYRPFDVLPEQVLNVRGLLLQEKQVSELRGMDGAHETSYTAEWIDVTGQTAYKESLFLEATLDSTGTLAVNLQRSLTEHSAVNHRALLADLEPEVYINEEVLQEWTAAQVDSFTIEHQHDLDENLRMGVSFALPEYAQAAGDYLYLNPVVLNRLDANSFVATERTYPVELTYPAFINYTLRLKLPPGYVVEEKPEDLIHTMPQGGGSYRRSSGVQGDVFSINIRYVGNDWYPADQYAALRAFHEAMVSAEAEQLVLRKVTPAASEQ